MSKLFISHSSKDDDFVRGLQQALGDLNQDVWIDSRELLGYREPKRSYNVRSKRG
jgi:hypothetical protein